MAHLFTFLTLFAVAAPAHSTSPGCLRYEPDTVVITGTIVRRMFYGAPGYGEDPKHDAKEPGFYLQLSAPVCTVGRQDNDAVKDAKLVQLVLDSAGYARLRPHLDQTVTLRGTLIPAMSGHHHAPILLTVVKPVHVDRRRGSVSESLAAERVH